MKRKIIYDGSFISPVMMNESDLTCKSESYAHAVQE